MAIEETTKNYLRLTDWQAVTKRFPSSTFDSEQKSFRVMAFIGRTYENEQIQRNLANIISRIESRNSGISIQRRSSMTGQPSGPTRTNVLEELAEELGIDTAGGEDSSSTLVQKLPSLVLPQQVKLILPDEAKIMLYPRGLRCSTCSYYILQVDMGKHTTLQCPGCGKDKLRQISNLFFCKKCGNQHEITPPFTEPERDGPRFRCTKDGCACAGTGHLKLKLERPLSRSKWICDKTGNEVSRVIYSCPSCARWTGVRDPAHMKLVSTTESYMKPMTFSTVYVSGNLEFSLENAVPTWTLNEAPSDVGQTIREYGIRDVHLIDDIESFTVVYGYAPYGDEVQPKTFKYRNPDTRTFEYHAYTTMSKGKAILVLLDKGRVCRVVLEDLAKEGADEYTRNMAKEYLKTVNEDPAAAYTWLAGLTRNVMTAHTATPAANTSLFKLLHSVEHALTHHASLRTGLDESTFVGKVLVDDCAVLIYERAQVEAGGVEYLARHLLAPWISGAVRHVRDCRYECAEGCVKCLYIQDPMCHPLLPREIPDTYLLPNALLSRKLLVDFWGLVGIATVVEKKVTDFDVPSDTDGEEED
ncbi:DUF1998 domain-containing protein [Nitrososphaera viennensis]|nr:DUF1998 domain-containing protein [Nitrososphaera viennensis]UVS69303.1 DUF1998 domain-containing protein [Nitrososphaera viennensis]